MTNELKHVSNAISVDYLSDIVSDLMEIQQNLMNAYESDTGSIQYQASQLQVQNRSPPIILNVAGTLRE